VGLPPREPTTPVPLGSGPARGCVRCPTRTRRWSASRGAARIVAASWPRRSGLVSRPDRSSTCRCHLPRTSPRTGSSRRCRCRAVTAGAPPAWAVGPAGYGPELPAQAANVLCGHYLPVGRSAALLAATLGVKVSTRFLAGIRRRAAGRLEDTLLPRVRDLLRTAGVLHVDETPGRAEGSLSYVHVGCTEFLTPCTPGTAARRRSTPAGCCPATPGSSCATATPATPTS